MYTEAASEGWKKKYAHSLKKTLLMSKELKRAQQAEQSVRQRLEEEQIRARGKQEELKHQTKLRMSELQMRLEMENEKKLLAQAAEDLAQQIHVLEEGKMIQEADMLRKHRQEIGAYEAKLVALHASLAKAQAQAQDRSLILVTVEDASSPCRKTDSRGSGSDSGGAVGAVDMQHVLAMKLIKKEADAWKRKHQKALVNTMKMKKK